MFQKHLLAAALGVASVWSSMGPAQAADVNVTFTEVSVGLEYAIGFGPNVVKDSVTGTSDGEQPAVVLLGGHTEGFYPLNPKIWHEITVESRASSSLAYDLTFGAPSIFGTSSASISYPALVAASGTTKAPSDQNYVLYEFEVTGGPTDYSVSYSNDATGYLHLKTLAGDTVLNLGDGQSHIGVLDPGIYSLTTWLYIAAANGETASGTSMFAMTFLDSTLSMNSFNGASDGSATIPGPIPAIPEPSTYVLLAAGLATLVLRQRRFGMIRPRI